MLILHAFCFDLESNTRSGPGNFSLLQVKTSGKFKKLGDLVISGFCLFSRTASTNLFCLFVFLVYSFTFTDFFFACLFFIVLKLFVVSPLNAQDYVIYWSALFLKQSTFIYLKQSTFVYLKTKHCYLSGKKSTFIYVKI